MIPRIASGRTRRFIVLAALGVTGAIAAPLYAFGGADKPLNKAEAVLHNSAGAAVGTVEFHQKHGVVKVKAKFDILPAGFHGFHVHTTGDCGGTAFSAAGAHLNPGGVNHGGHAGDMPVLLVNTDGSAEASFETDRFTVDDLVSGDGSAVIVHANADNYANIPTVPYGGPVGTTLTTGDAGGRFACGVIGTKHEK